MKIRSLFALSAFLLGTQLLQPDGRRQPRRAGADDDNVVVHGFAFFGLAHGRRARGRPRRLARRRRRARFF